MSVISFKSPWTRCPHRSTEFLCSGLVCCSVAPVRVDLHRLRTQQFRSRDGQPGPVPGQVQRGPVLGRHGDVLSTVDEQTRSAAEKIHQNRRLVSEACVCVSV